MDYKKTFYEDQMLYLAGPECFYPDCNKKLLAMRRLAEAYGFGVSLPNDRELKLDHEDLRKNADAIFENCALSINETTAILVDLETFRGAEPDGGSICELGMAYARGLRCYGYSRDMRSTVHKYQGAALQDGRVVDLDGRLLPYKDLPYSPCVVGSSKLVQGDLDDCLRVLMLDLDEERKNKGRRLAPAQAPSAAPTAPKGARPRLYIAGQNRYEEADRPRFEQMKQLAERLGFEAACPLDDAPGIERIQTDDPLAQACNTFDHWQQQVRNCDVILADLNDFHGWEPNNDVSFEVGMAWQLGKVCFGHMQSTANMRTRIPHYGDEMENRDWRYCDVENFNYPINLMFSSSMPILEGGFEAVMEQVAAACREKGML